MRFIILILMIVLQLNLNTQDIIIHSNMTFEEAIKGSKAPKEIINAQRLIDVEYYNFEGKLCRGQLVVHQSLVKDFKEAFELIKSIKFPIKQCIPIVKYNWDDNASMEDNNTSAFNFRYVAGTTRYSNHAEGRAIDINPFQNPAIYNSGKISPKGSKYDLKSVGTLTPDSEIVKFFKNRSYRWGGDWTSLKDYQHFDKTN